MGVGEAVARQTRGLRRGGGQPTAQAAPLSAPRDAKAAQKQQLLTSRPSRPQLQAVGSDNWSLAGQRRTLRRP
eukprot:scaffold31667_cov107-Isochrysis_galbana.AAC.5